MWFAIDGRAAVPVYEQIRSHLAGAIATGEAAPGSRLPSAQALAGELGVAVNTVIRAYRELSHAGLIVSRRRFGTVVAERIGASAPPDVQAAATRLVMRALAAGLDLEQVVDLVRSTGGTALAPATTASSQQS